MEVSSEVKLILERLHRLSDLEKIKILNQLEGLSPHVREALKEAISIGEEDKMGIVLNQLASNNKIQRMAQADYEATAPAGDISQISGHPETQGLFTQYSQPEIPPETSQALDITNIAQKFFGGGASPEEAQTIIQRTIWEINVLMQSLEFFAKKGVKDPQSALELMKNKEGTIILYDPSDPYAQWHERQHALGREMSPEQFKEYIKSKMGANVPDEAREAVAQGIVDQETKGLLGTGAYGQQDIPGELAARQQELENKYSQDVLDQLAQGFIKKNPDFTID